MVPYATEVCSPSLRVQKLKLKMLAGLVSPKSCKGEFTRPSLLASGGCWHSLELLGLELPSHLRLCAHRAFSSLSVCLKSPSPLIRTLVIDVDIHYGERHIWTHKALHKITENFMKLKIFAWPLGPKDKKKIFLKVHVDMITYYDIQVTFQIRKDVQ